ncbi:MAG: LicD family protein [Lachnospiraceae bacterium]|nr:LicD family protein [Lachnospiraceae bacterium]
MDLFKRGKGLYSRWFPEYRLDDDTLLKLQDCLLEMLKEFTGLCEKYGIRYMAAGATLLGAVRHKGFVPWDDDIDIMMMRSEYEKLVWAIKKEKREGRLKDRLLARPLRTKRYYFKIPKYYNKNTEYLSINYMGNPAFNMVGLDIFIADRIPENPVHRHLRALAYDFSFYASSFCLDYIFPSPVIEKKSATNPEVRRFYSFRKALGCVFAHVGGMRFYLTVCERLARYRGKSRLYGLPSGISYLREVFDRTMFTQLTTADFCGLKISIPIRYDEYLRNLYGDDYMKLPPADRREIHTACRVRLKKG